MSERPLCLLALDGGGVRGLSELRILEEIMDRIKYDLKLDDDQDPLPADYFDLIGGSSTGGLIALLLGRLRLSVPEARAAFIRISKDVFSMDKEQKRFDETKLQEALKRTVTQYLGQDAAEEKMLAKDKDPKCKVFVCSVAAKHANSGPRLFRTYRVRRNQTFNCKIWEAGRATSAAPTYFKPIKIGPEDEEGEEFVDAGIGYNNPIKQVLAEAKRLYKEERKVACIVSIGAGQSDVITYGEPVHPGKPFAEDLIKALYELAVDSDRTAEEVEQDFAEFNDLYFRFSVDRGLDRVLLEEWEKIPEVKTYTTSYMQLNEVSTRIDRVVSALLTSRRHQEMSGGQIPHADGAENSSLPLELPWSGEPPVVNIEVALKDLSLRPNQKRPAARYKLPLFNKQDLLGRAHELEQLEQKLFGENQPRIAAITGLGGVGKTHVALALAYRIRAKYPECSIFWVSCTSLETIEQAYMEIALKLGMNITKPAEVKEQLKCYLSLSNREWLLIFDSADDMDMWTKGGNTALRNIVPESEKGRVIFTSRNHRLAVELVSHHGVRISEPDEDASGTMFEKLLDNPYKDSHAVEKEMVAAIVKKLACLPLAIVQAAAYINAISVSLADYLDLLQDQQMELLSKEFNFEDENLHEDFRKQNPVITTWLISFQQIQKLDPLAAEYLSIMACVNPGNIPRSFLPQSSSKKKRLEAIGLLKSFAFVTEGDDNLNLHRLVYLATRVWMRMNNVFDNGIQRTAAQLAEVFPSQSTSKQWRKYLPHALSLIDEARFKNQREQFTSLLQRIGECLLSDGRHMKANEIFLDVMSLLRKMRGIAHPSTRVCMSLISRTYEGRTRWCKLEEFELEVVETQTQELGSEHPSTLTTKSNLAFIYYQLWRWHEAEVLQVKTLEVQKRVLPSDHPNILTSMQQLAKMYQTSRRHNLAEELQSHVLEAQKQALGLGHPVALASMRELAHIYECQGRQDKAEELQVQTLEDLKRVLPHDHPTILHTMHHLAKQYEIWRRWNEAGNLLVRVLESQKRSLGPQHPDTRSSMADLAGIYQNQQRWHESEQLQLELLEIERRSLGPGDLKTLMTMSSLAYSYSVQGRFNEAEELQLEVLHIEKGELESEHPKTLSYLDILACGWKWQSKTKEAFCLMAECIELHRKHLGSDHPNTIGVIRILNDWQNDHSSLSSITTALEDMKEVTQPTLNGQESGYRKFKALFKFTSRR